MLSHANLVANAFHLQAAYRFEDDTRWLIAAPLFHAAGSIAVLATVWHGGRHVVLADVRPRRRRRPHRLGAGHGHAARAHDAGGDERRAARPTARRLDAAADRPRWLADRHRDVAPGARGLPGRRADAHLRGHRDVADGDLPAPRGAAARHAAGPFVRPGVRRRRHRHRRRRWRAVPGRRRRRGRRPRPQRDGRVLEQAGRDGRRARRRPLPHGRPRLPRRRRQPVPRRPGQGHDRHGRRERVQHRGRGRALPPSGRARGRRLRHPRRPLGRGRARRRRAARRGRPCPS